MPRKFRRGNKIFAETVDGIFFIGLINEFGEVKKVKPRLVKSKKRDVWGDSNSWGDSGGSWGNSSGWDSSNWGGGLFDSSSGGLWDDDTKLSADDDMFSSGGQKTEGSLWDDTQTASSDLFEDTKNSEVNTTQSDNKTYHPYKFSKDITQPDIIELNKPAHPWAIKSKDNEEHIVVFQTEEVYTLKENITATVISAILGETNIAPKEIPEEFNKFLYGMLNAYLVNLTFTSIQNFIVDYNSLKSMELEEADKRAMEKVDSIFKEMFSKPNYSKGDRLKIILEKRILLSNKEQITVEVESFDTLDWVDISNDSYLHEMMKEFGPLHYLKVDSKTYIIRDNKIRILHIED